MFKGTITAATAYTAATNLPFVAKINSNTSTSYSSGVVYIQKPGFYSVDVNINATGIAAGNATAQILANGNILAGSAQTQTSTATTDALPYNLHDVIYVRPAQLPARVELSVSLSKNATISNANMIVCRIK